MGQGVRITLSALRSRLREHLQVSGRHHELSVSRPDATVLVTLKGQDMDAFEQLKVRCSG